MPARSPGTMRASVSSSRRRCRRPEPVRTALRVVEPRTRRPTRSPRRRWCSATAPAARTATSRLLAAAGHTPAASEVDTASTRSSTRCPPPPRCWPRAAPVRSETRHCTRRSRSPARRAGCSRTPCRRPGGAPDGPPPSRSGAAPAPGVEGRGHRERGEACRRRATGPQKWPAQRLVAPTSPSPRTRRPHRRLAKGTSTVTWSAGTGAEVPTTPLAGLAAHHRCRVSTATDAPRPPRRDGGARPVPSPSRIVVCITALCGSGCNAGGRASAITAARATAPRAPRGPDGRTPRRAGCPGSTPAPRGPGAADATRDARRSSGSPAPTGSPLARRRGRDCASRLSTMLCPETLLIHSSGLTVIRCASTGTARRP